MVDCVLLFGLVSLNILYFQVQKKNHMKVSWYKSTPLVTQSHFVAIYPTKHAL